MTDTIAEASTLQPAGGQTVSALLTAPTGAKACLVLAHGAGAGMHHSFMASLADGLAFRDVACLRYQFPYMERGSRRPDSPELAHATVRAAVAAAGERLPGMPLFAGGKSFGGRMTSQAQAQAPLPGVRGLVFFGFPLHPAGKPAVVRAEHLSDVQVPMLFLQGTRDALAQMGLLDPVIQRLGEQTTLDVINGADHSFHVPAKHSETDQEVLNRLLDSVVDWMAAHAE